MKRKAHWLWKPRVLFRSSPKLICPPRSCCARTINLGNGFIIRSSRVIWQYTLLIVIFKILPQYTFYLSKSPIPRWFPNQCTQISTNFRDFKTLSTTYFSFWGRVCATSWFLNFLRNFFFQSSISAEIGVFPLVYGGALTTKQGRQKGRGLW